MNDYTKQCHECILAELCIKLNRFLFSFLLLNMLPWEYVPAQHQVNQENYSNANLWATWITKCCLNGLKKHLCLIVQISEHWGRSILTSRFWIASHGTFEEKYVSDINHG